ncbi:uncharacterized protein LOC127838789 [Dreissena polymorpha]|uniref:B box-type domain-containing protein n=1 Tax=Dreissena polymorpha TaxID=45954 RepID=A0A9D4FHC7_DREPO|nr:uncharacterized protein LOC127838789 [Dreissena polymorpha]KAH3798775.1 hypothetical protein DPMN_152378 [Dreissena polymorpha]
MESILLSSRRMNMCDEHVHEPLRFYCTFHNDVICSICAIKRHKLCQDTLTFQEAIERFEREHKNLFKALENQSANIEKNISEKQAALELLARNSIDATSQIEHLTKKLHAVIEEKKRVLLKTLNEETGEVRKELSNDLTFLTKMSKTMTKVKDKALGAFKCKAEVRTIKTMIRVQNIYCDIEKSSKIVLNHPTQYIYFQESQELQDFLENLQTIGSISRVQNIDDMDNDGPKDQADEGNDHEEDVAVAHDGDNDNGNAEQKANIVSLLHYQMDTIAEIDSSSEHDTDESDDVFNLSGKHDSLINEKVVVNDGIDLIKFEPVNCTTGRSEDSGNVSEKEYELDDTSEDKSVMTSADGMNADDISECSMVTAMKHENEFIEFDDVEEEMLFKSELVVNVKHLNGEIVIGCSNGEPVEPIDNNVSETGETSPLENGFSDSINSDEDNEHIVTVDDESLKRFRKNSDLDTCLTVRLNGFEDGIGETDAASFAETYNTKLAHAQTNNALLEHTQTNDTKLAHDVATETESYEAKTAKIADQFLALHHGRPCWIYGIAFLTHDRIVISDVAHDSLQLFDTRGVFICEEKVAFTPWDTSKMDNQTIVVCSGVKGSVYIFNVNDGGFDLKKKVDIGSDCNSVFYSNKGTFIIGSRKGCLICKSDGSDIKAFSTHSVTEKSLRRADFIIADDVSGNIFMVNSWSGKITALTSEGQILWESHSGGVFPRGIVINGNRIFVSCKARNCITIMDSSDGRHIDDVTFDELEYPYALALHPTENILAVTRWDEKMTNGQTRIIQLVRY